MKHLGFSWFSLGSDPGAVELGGQLGEREKQESAQSFLLQAGKSGLESWSECFDQAVEIRLLRNILGFGELEMEENPSFFKPTEIHDGEMLNFNRWPSWPTSLGGGFNYYLYFSHFFGKVNWVVQPPP